MKWPWSKPQQNPSEPDILDIDPMFAMSLHCEFCCSRIPRYEFEGREFCSRWCINYYILNDHRMPGRCAQCGWRGCYTDLRAVPGPHSPGPYFLCKKDKPEGPACWDPGVTDDDFEKYRQKILRGLGQRPLKAAP